MSAAADGSAGRYVRQAPGVRGRLCSLHRGLCPMRAGAYRRHTDRLPGATGRGRGDDPVGWPGPARYGIPAAGARRGSGCYRLVCGSGHPDRPGAWGHPAALRGLAGDLFCKHPGGHRWHLAHAAQPGAGLPGGAGADVRRGGRSAAARLAAGPAAGTHRGATLGLGRRASLRPARAVCGSGGGLCGLGAARAAADDRPAHVP